MGSITSQNLSFDEQGQIITAQVKETPVVKEEIKKEITKGKK